MQLREILRADFAPCGVFAESAVFAEELFRCRRISAELPLWAKVGQDTRYPVPEGPARQAPATRALLRPPRLGAKGRSRSASSSASIHPFAVSGPPGGPSQKIEFACQPQNREMEASGDRSPSPSPRTVRPGRMRADDSVFSFPTAPLRRRFAVSLQSLSRCGPQPASTPLPSVSPPR
jgi:hypothetical protein